MYTSSANPADDDPFDLGDDPGETGHDIGVLVEPPEDTSVVPDRSVSEATTTNDSGTDLLTPAQRYTFEHLLSVGTERPLAPVDLVEQLRRRIAEGTSDALATWGQSLWFSKSMLTEAQRCEGMIVANVAEMEAGGPTKSLHSATMMGIVAHLAIQIHHTHPGEPPGFYVNEAIRSSRNEERFGETWLRLGEAERSELQMTATSRLIAFVDSWPPLRDEWSWRFEESAQSKVGKLTLGARMDLVLGRPRADGRQTMFLCDMKTGSLGEHHELEASFYALVSALRWGVPPWRSTVYSLASGEWSDPDVTPEALKACADAVVAATNARVAVLCEEREAVLTAGEWCRFCPAAPTCPANPDNTTTDGDVVVEDAVHVELVVSGCAEHPDTSFV